MVNQDNSENPFQSPMVPETHPGRPFPATLFCGVALVAFCLVLLWVELGIGILASVLVVPGLLRGFILIRRRSPGGRAGTGPVSAVLISILLMIPILIASGLAFGISCFAAAIVMSGFYELIPNPEVPTRDPPTGLILTALLICLVCGALAYAVMFWLLLPTGKKHQTKQDVESEAEEIQ